jgi:hypothetical protein
MFCKYCGKASGDRDICSACEEKIKNFMENGGSEQGLQSGAANGNNSSVSSSRNQQVYNWDEAHSNETVEVNEEKTVEYKGFFTLPRIISFIGIIIFTACLFMPMFQNSESEVYILTDLNNGEVALAIPLFMLLNTIFDRSISRVTFSGGIPHRAHGFFRFRLLIVWGVIGIITLLGLRSYFGSGYDVSNGIYYFAFVGCGLTIIAPFFVRENDGTGLKPIRKYDYIWIVLVAVIAVVLCYKMSVTNNDSEDVYTSSVEDTTDSYESKYEEVEKDYNEYAASNKESTVAETEAPVVDNSAEESYRAKLRDFVANYGRSYCIYDVNKDGIDDVIVPSYYDIYAYEVYVYENNEFVGAQGDNGPGLYSYNGLYACDDSGLYSYYEDADNGIYRYIKYRYSDGNLTEDYSDYVSIEGNDYFVDGNPTNYDMFNQKKYRILNSSLYFYDLSDSTAIENARYNR